MKKCELCESPAKMFCESDEAGLCWDCDPKVHGANFLVANHSRTLLCHVCQSLTPWKGSVPKLGPTISVCNVCVVGNRSISRVERDNGEAHDDNNDSHDDDDDDDDDGDDDEEEEEEENQVVPWSSTPPAKEESSSKFWNGEEGISTPQIALSMERLLEAT